MWSPGPERQHHLGARRESRRSAGLPKSGTHRCAITNVVRVPSGLREATPTEPAPIEGLHLHPPPMLGAAGLGRSRCLLIYVDIFQVERTQDSSLARYSVHWGTASVSSRLSAPSTLISSGHAAKHFGPYEGETKQAGQSLDNPVDSGRQEHWGSLYYL